MRIAKIAGLAAVSALATLAVYQAQLKAGWGAPFACGAGPNTSKINWDNDASIPTEETRAVATGQTEVKPVEDPDLSVDLAALAKKKPLLVYYFVANVTDPMNDNYKFSRKFELSVLGEEIVETLNKNFICKKVELPAEADMKLAKNQARIEIWSPTDKKVGTIGVEQESMLNKTPFLGFMKVRIAKSGTLVKAEIARIQKLREKAAEPKKETAQVK